MARFSIWVYFSLMLLVPILSRNSCLALYEDQVGIMDWHQQYIGKVKDVVFHTQKAGRKRVVVATEENVIASLDLRRGDIFWRHVLAETDAINGIDVAAGKYVITLSSQGSILRAWNLPDGQMIWESHLKGSFPSKSLLAATVKVEKDIAVLAFSGGLLHAVSSIDGAILWSTELSLDSLEIQGVFLSPNEEQILAAGLVGGSQLVLCHISSSSGEILKRITGSFPGGFYGDVSFVSIDKLLLLDASRSAIVSAVFSDGNVNFHSTPLSDLVRDIAWDLAILPLKFVDMFALKTKSSILLIRVSAEGKLVIVEKVNSPACISDSVLLSEGQQAFAVVQQEDHKVTLKVKLDNSEKTELIKDSTEIDSQRGLVEKVFINSYIRTDRSYGFRALILMEDHSLFLLQQGEVVWSREDGLASIVDTTTSELPVERGVSVAKVEQNLFEWLKGHMLKLKSTLMLASPEDIAAIQDMRLKSSEKSKMTRDHNGFRKLIIVLTKSGKVLALHTGDGRVVWSLLLSSLRKSDACPTPSVFKIYNWQVPHHHAMDTNPSILVLGGCGTDAEASHVISFVDCYTGKELNFFNLPYSVVQVIPLSATDSTEHRLHLLIDANKQAHLFPRSTDALNKLKGELENIYFYSVDKERQIIMGHMLENHCTSDIADEYCFNSRQLWSVMFPSGSEVIAKTTIRMRNEVNMKGVEAKFQPIWDIIDRRWDSQMHRPLHAAALYLNPGLYYDYEGIETSVEIKDHGLFVCISRLAKSPIEQERIFDQLNNYRHAIGGFGIDMAIKKRKEYAPVDWWLTFGTGCPELLSFAVKILGLTCSASPCERNWSTFERVVHTQAKILSDQDVMYKYISKNLLFVATVAPKASGRIGSCTPDEAWLVAYLLDIVTGRILHRVTHLGSQGPINAVFSENWVIYHYFNLRAHRYEMTVMEIYDESRAGNKDVLKLVLGKHNLTTPISSYSRPDVSVKSQSYFFTHSVKTMAVTATVKGITSKQILIGTVADQVLALDKRFLDPRRTVDPTPAEKEEGIIPLTDALTIVPQSYITHSILVEGLRDIVTVPSRLESTTLAFAYGIDLFFTRLAPSRTYDSLTEDFSYALLLITIIALIAAIVITWILSERKELREKWT